MAEIEIGLNVESSNRKVPAKFKSAYFETEN
jgi:hypothetical protein